MNKNTSNLVSISKICSGISGICIVFMIISSMALSDAGFFAALVLSAVSSAIALISIISALIAGVDKSALLILLMVANIILLLVYAAVVAYIFFIVPVAVNEMMNS